MANLQLTPIDLPFSENFAIVRHGINRQWKILTLILVAVIIILTILFTVVVFKRSSSYHSIDEITTTTTRMETSNRNSIDAESTFNIMATSVDSIDEKETTVTYNRLPILYTPFPISNFSGFQTSLGLPLNHSLYFNINHASDVTGYVINVTLRLFTSWEGNYPLYIYALQEYSIDFVQITDRYPLIPESNTTEWQTIAIPFGLFPIYINDFIALGMQDQSETNQMYAITSSMSIHGKNILNDTKDVYKKATEGWYGAAFIYTVIQNGN